MPMGDGDRPQARLRLESPKEKKMHIRPSSIPTTAMCRTPIIDVGRSPKLFFSPCDSHLLRPDLVQSLNIYVTRHVRAAGQLGSRQQHNYSITPWVNYNLKCSVKGLSVVTWAGRLWFADVPGALALLLILAQFIER
ncbi:hypothetical protein EVAR_37380_1 [Eumeta japonica]|uniref:Uncharacterized protein n=1 Tax=Eumeta variegata TaxID=151549 RepID=A0A4C1ZQV9_EUMVA|nr:hypothetical protein EVAR_37380_1 [Eumeta japonica]